MDAGLDTAKESAADDRDAQTAGTAHAGLDASRLAADAMDGMPAKPDAQLEAGSAEAGAAAADCACAPPEARVAWIFPASPQGFYNVDQPVEVRSEVANVTWFEDLYFVGETELGARIGFESQGLRPDGSIGKVAVFTMYGATAAIGDHCQVGHGPLPETTCRVAFEFVEDEVYVWRIWRQLDDEATWWWWGAWVRIASDLDAQVAIGELRGPPGRNLIRYSEAGVRHRDVDRACKTPLPSFAYFAQPLLNGSDLRATAAAIGDAGVSACPTAQRKPIPDAGVEVRFGAP